MVEINKREYQTVIPWVLLHEVRTRLVGDVVEGGIGWLMPIWTDGI